MSQSTAVEFVYEGGRCRAELAYDRMRRSERICRECGRADQEVAVSVQVLRVWCADSEIPQDDAQFSILAQAAEAEFRKSPAYGEALADAGPL